MRNIVILGGGFGGVRAARDLARKVDTAAWRIILIDRNNFHGYTPLYYEIAAAYLGADEPSEETLRSCSTIPLARVLPPAVEFVQGEVCGIDYCRQTVQLTDATVIAFEYLVVALGAVPDYFGIPGLETFAHTFLTVPCALAIHRAMRVRMEAARHGKQIAFMVGGGGPSGVEFAAELAHFLHKQEARGVIAKGAMSVILVEASSRVLGLLPLKASQYAHKRLAWLGVRVMLDTCIKSVKPASISAAPKGQSGAAQSVAVVLAPRPLKFGEQTADLACDFLPAQEHRMMAGMLIWAGGTRANPLLARCKIPVDRKGRVEVDAYFQVKGQERIFAIGDCALRMDDAAQMPVPALAQAAIAEAKLVARNITAALSSRPPVAYSLTKFPTVLPLGGKCAVAVAGRVILKGWLGWLIREAAYFLYFDSLLPCIQAIRVFTRGLKVYTRND